MLNDKQVARGLGWFGIGLGLAKLLAPRAVARASGWKGTNASFGCSVFAKLARACCCWPPVTGNAGFGCVLLVTALTAPYWELG